MTRDERIAEMMEKPCFRNWSRKDCEDELKHWSDKDISNGYVICDHDGTGMYEICAIDCMDAFGGDDAAATQKAMEDGVRVIPVEDLPENFDWLYLGWIDTPENRANINKYCAEMEMRG